MPRLRRCRGIACRLAHVAWGALSALAMLNGLLAAAAVMILLFIYYEHLELLHDLVSGVRVTRADWPEEELAEFMVGFGAAIGAWLIAAQLGG